MANGRRACSCQRPPPLRPCTRHRVGYGTTAFHWPTQSLMRRRGLARGSHFRLCRHPACQKRHRRNPDTNPDVQFGGTQAARITQADTTEQIHPPPRARDDGGDTSRNHMCPHIRVLRSCSTTARILMLFAMVEENSRNLKNFEERKGTSIKGGTKPSS